MPHVRPLIGAALAAAALAAAGCGSSNDDDGAAKAPAPTASTTPSVAPAPPAATPDAAPAQSGPAPTKASYVKRADAVCREARNVSRSANSVVSQAFQAGDAGRAADAIDNYTPMFAEHMAKLKALRQPEGEDVKLLSGLIRVMDGQVQALRDEAVALRHQDDATLQEITKAQQQEVQFAEELGRQYGFKVCGRAG